MSAFVLFVLMAAAPAEVPLLTLEQAQYAAQERNFDLKIARQRLEKSFLLINEAWSILLPVITGTGTVTRNELQIALSLPAAPGAPPTSFVIQKKNEASAVAAFSWVLANARSIPLIRNAYDSVEVAQLSFRQTALTLHYAVAIAYFSVLGAEDQVDIRKRSLEIAQSNVKLAKARLAVGEGTHLELLRFEVEAAAEEQRLIRARNSARVAYRALATLMDRVLPDGSVPPFRVERPPAPAPPPPRNLIQDAYSGRLDLQSNELQLEIAQGNRLDTWMKFLPVLVADGSYRYTSVPSFQIKSAVWQLNLSLRWTVFDAGLRFWELEQRAHEINEAQLAIDKTRLDIAEQVTEARLNLESSRAAFDVAKRRVDLSRQSDTLIRAEFKVGTATQTDVLDADRTLSVAETSLALAQLNVDLDALALERSLVIPPHGAFTVPTQEPPTFPTEPPVPIPSTAGAQPTTAAGITTTAAPGATSPTGLQPGAR